MEIQAQFPRRPTRQVMVGDVAVGGGAPISVQSMTTTKTADVEGTLAQIYALAAAGADIVRCTCNELEAAEGLAEIVPRSPVPIVADIHHQYRMALAALEANVQCLRLNPGNIRRPEHIKTVAAECRDRGVPIRIGVNGGSLHPDLYARYGGKVTPEAMVTSALDELAYFREVGFDLVKISVKASSVPLMIDAYRQLAEVTDHPLHLGVTEAGPPPAGVVKSTAGIATLLAEGIGDTIRYSLTADPVTEAKAGRSLLEALGLRERKNVDLIACPSCGRAEVDVFKIANEALEAFGEREIPLQVAVMGCVVNGPGEARDADLGIAAGRGRGHLFVKGQNVAVVPEDEMVESLVAWATLICEEGMDAALARADTERAQREGRAGQDGPAERPGRRRQRHRLPRRTRSPDRRGLTPGALRQGAVTGPRVCISRRLDAAHRYTSGCFRSVGGEGVGESHAFVVAGGPGATGGRPSRGPGSPPGPCGYHRTEREGDARRNGRRAERRDAGQKPRRAAAGRPGCRVGGCPVGRGTPARRRRHSRRHRQ